MLGPAGITTFNDSPPPPGESPFVSRHVPTTELSIAQYDPSWPAHYERLAGLIRAALGRQCSPWTMSDLRRYLGLLQSPPLTWT